MIVNPPPKPSAHSVNSMDLDPREEYFEDILVTTKYIK